MKKFTVRHSDRVIDEPYCQIERQDVILPDGSETEWWIRHQRPAVVVVPILPDGQVLLQRQYKHGAGEVVVEFPARLTDADESPEVAAARELREETGYTCEKMEMVGELWADPTGSSMQYFFFVAHECVLTDDTDLDDAEQIEPFLVADLAAAADEILQNSDTSAATICALRYAERAKSGKKS